MGILRKLGHWISFKLEASLLEQMLDVECPHNPLDPCVACDNEARALRW